MDVLQSEQTLEQQTGSYQQHRGESDFTNNQKTPKPIASRSFSGTAPTLFECLVHIGIRRLQGRDKSKKKARGKRNNQRKHKDAQIEANFIPAGRCLGYFVTCPCDEHAHTPPRENRTESAAPEGKESAFGE